jgi:DNA-binding CsgD family transcriptional regulator
MSDVVWFDKAQGVEMPSPREMDVLQCLVDGMGYRQIARTLQIDYRTARTHGVNLCRKLKADSSLHAVAIARRVGLGQTKFEGDCMTDADVFDLARAELARARAKYPAWPSDLVHAAAIASEESGEVVKACNSYVWQQGDETPADIRKEAVQAIAMFVRLLTESEVLRG